MKEMGKYKIALFVDCPNMMRGYLFELSDIEEATKGYGIIILKNAYIKVNPIKPEKSTRLADTACKKGFKVIIRPYDIDVKMGMDAADVIKERDDIDLIAMATSDSGFRDVIDLANERGKDTLVLYADECKYLLNAYRYGMNMREYIKRKSEGHG